jgi:hypothetical protein
MSSKKRVSLSPASAANFKRHASLHDESDLQCLICHELVLDATQTTCCGAMHCRRCISHWMESRPTCPSCRKPLSADEVVPDARNERLSAARLRACAYAQHGCKFEGNRTAVSSHEQECESVPRSVLRQAARLVENEWEQRLLEKDQQIDSLEQFCERQEMIRERLLRSALGPDPANNAIRIMYGFSPCKFLARVKRQDVIDEIEPFFSFPQYAVAFRIIEKNHNVAV